MIVVLDVVGVGVGVGVVAEEIDRLLKHLHLQALGVLPVEGGEPVENNRHRQDQEN